MISVIIPDFEVPITLVDELEEEENGSRSEAKEFSKDQGAINMGIF